MPSDLKADLYRFAKAQRESNARLELWDSAAEAVGYLDAIAVLQRLEELEAENQRLRLVIVGEMTAQAQERGEYDDPDPHYTSKIDPERYM